jgi:hypothetical protein
VTGKLIQKKVSTVAILLLLFIPIVSSQGQIGNAKEPRKRPIFYFSSDLEMMYDAGVVNNATFTPDGPPVSIPLYIKYRVDVPNFFLKPPFLFLKNWFIFGSFIRPSQQIHLSTANPPEWATISIGPSDPYIDIDNTFHTRIAILQIALHHNAPSEAYELRITADTPHLGKIQEADAELNLIFQPEWIPLLNIDVSQPLIRTPPNETSSTTINITNLGNAMVMVTAIITEIDGWSIYLEMTQLTIPIGETYSDTLYLKPPENFQGIQEINITFEQMRFPPSGETGPSLPIMIYAYYP